MNEERLVSILKRRLDKGFEQVTFEELGTFLDGLDEFYYDGEEI